MANPPGDTMPPALAPDTCEMLRAEWLPILAIALGCSGSGKETPAPAEPIASAGRPRSAERGSDRMNLVEHLERRGIRDPRVLQAMRDVPRHWFVPEEMAALAYEDDALPIGEGQTISQPYIVALMTEALGLSSGSKVLEIGTGSGYQAAILSELTPNVWTIEIVPELARSARATFERHGYDTIRCRLGDGWEGWAEEAPFDAVIVTAAPERVPQKLFDQLAIGGRMCIPIGPNPSNQQLLLVRKLQDGSMASEPLAPVRFVPMTGGERSER